MKSSLTLTAAAMLMVVVAQAETPLIPHPGAPSAVVRSGPAAIMGPTANPGPNSTPATLPVAPTPPVIPAQTAAPVQVLAPAPGQDDATNPSHKRGKQNTAARSHPVTSVLPSGMGTYTYYQNSNTYYNPRTKTYYYQQNKEWKAGVSAPVGQHLGGGRTVQLEGESNVNGANN